MVAPAATKVPQYVGKGRTSRYTERLRFRIVLQKAAKDLLIVPNCDGVLPLMLAFGATIVDRAQSAADDDTYDVAAHALAESAQRLAPLVVALAINHAPIVDRIG